jgi:hypothetical protein
MWKDPFQPTSTLFQIEDNLLSPRKYGNDPTKVYDYAQRLSMKVACKAKYDFYVMLHILMNPHFLLMRQSFCDNYVHILHDDTT